MAITDNEVIATRNDAEMMSRPHLWQTRALPLKRPRHDGQLPETAVLLRPEDGQPLQLIENDTLFGPLGDTKLCLFQRVDQIVAAGWMVD